MTVVKSLFILAILAIITIIAVSFWLYSSLSSPHEHGKANQFVVIEKGMAPNAIIDKLTEEGVIASPLATTISGFVPRGKLYVLGYMYPSRLRASGAMSRTSSVFSMSSNTSCSVMGTPSLVPGAGGFGNFSEIRFAMSNRVKPSGIVSLIVCDSPFSSSFKTCSGVIG